MKIIFLFLHLLAASICQSQLLKKVLNDTKNEAEWKIRSKARQKTSEAIDTILSSQKKEENKSKKQTQSRGSTTLEPASKNEEEGMNGEDGYITLSVSANEVFKGGTVVITGSSIKYGNFNTVKLNIKGPDINKTQTLALYDNNTYVTNFQAENSGDYVISAISSNGKAKETATIKVLEMELTDWEENEEEVNKSFDLFKKNVDKVKQQIGNKDALELEQKMKEMKENIDLLVDFFQNARQITAEAAKLKTAVPAGLQSSLSQLNDLFWKQKNEMQQLRQAADHEPYNNTICEHLTMVNEAAQAFTTITSLFGKVLVTAFKKARDSYGDATGPAANLYKPLNGALMGSEVKALRIQKMLGLNEPSSKMSTLGFAGNVVQYSSEYLMKKYCGLFSGEIKHDYTVIHRNTSGVDWWRYTYHTEGVITLRYPKSTTGGKIIKMKGNIEGNATKFVFYQNVEEEDEFKKNMKERAKLKAIEILKPVAVPFSTSKNDVAGFGALARGIATPAYFNIPIDAEYDTDTEKIKLFLNTPIIDFTQAVRYTYAFIAIAAGIPLCTVFDFPVEKAKLTLNAVVSKNNELEVKMDPKGGQWVSGSGTRQIGDVSSPIEHRINYKLTARKNQ